MTRGSLGVVITGGRSSSPRSLDYACGRGATPRGSASAGAGTTCRRALPACTGAAPTYSADVRPILERRCFKCHAGDGVAADEHDFSHVEILRAQKGGLAGEIGACAMPPSTEPALPDGEAEVLLRWVACGASE